MRAIWIKYALIVLVLEKIVQHIFVTIAFALNWGNIRSTVAIDPDLLMVLGAVAAALFLLALYGMIAVRKWTVSLLLGLAVFDLLGEFAAQGKIAIVITVSFLVALILLVLTLFYRRWRPQVSS